MSYDEKYDDHAKKFLLSIPAEEAFKLHEREGEMWKPVYPEDLFLVAWKVKDFCPMQRIPQYRISSRGRLWSRKLHRMVEPWRTGKKGSSHLMVSVYGKKMTISNLVAIMYIGIPDGMTGFFKRGEITSYHIDGNDENNHIGNLGWKISKKGEPCENLIRFNFPDADVKSPDERREEGFQYEGYDSDGRWVGFDNEEEN